MCAFFCYIVSIMETRGKAKIYLLGSYEREILGSKLPSYRQAFGHFLYLHKVEEMTVRDASRQAIEIVLAFWSKAGIQVRAVKHCIDKLETVFVDWKCLLKHKNRKTPGHKLKENEFLERLDDLFDIAHSDALVMITIPEDRTILISQRQKGLPGSIGCLDKVENDRRQRVQERKEKERKRHKRSQEEQEACSSQVVLETDSSSSSAAQESDDDEEQKKSCSGEVTAPKRARINILSPSLTSALDRTKVSSRSATFILSEVASSLE